MEYAPGLVTKATTIYSPLSDSNEIRLLDLQPRRPGEGIKCTMRHVKLSENPQYEALSYMWAPKEHRQIEIDGVVVEVRWNLWNALLELRHEQDARTLWIDAICINQDDISERNHQVTQMGTIYKNSVRCVAWLGPSDSLLNDAFTFMVEAEDTATASISYNRLFCGNSPSEWDIHLLRGLLSLCLRPYWERLWIIQEILLAPDFRLQCGPNTIDKAYLRLLFQQLEGGFETIKAREPFLGLQSMHLLSERKTSQQNMRNSMALSLIMDPRFAGEESHLTGHTRRSILQLCSIYGKAKCEDQRDKIFGLLGIASSCCSKDIRVDYSSTLPELAQAVLLHHIHEHQNGVLETLESSIDFHHSLAITPIDYRRPSRSPTQIPRVKGEPRAKKRIITPAELFDYGPLQYISPLLDGSVRLERCQIPPLRRELEWALKKLLSAEGSTWMDKKSLHSRITVHLDLVFPLDHATDCEVVFASAISPESPDRDLLDAHPILFRKFMLECQAALAQSCQILQSKNKRLAVCGSGLTLLVPENVRTGDLTCRIRGRNDLIIIRPSERYPCVGYPVARSVFNLWSVDPDGDFGGSLTEFKLNLYTLQMMSVTSSFHPEQAEERDQNQMEATGLRLNSRKPPHSQSHT